MEVALVCNQRAVDHAVKKQMLKWEVKFDIQALSQVIENLDGGHHLRHVVNEVHVLICAVRSTHTVELECSHALELGIGVLGSCKGL